MMPLRSHEQREEIHHILTINIHVNGGAYGS